MVEYLTANTYYTYTIPAHLKRISITSGLFQVSEDLNF